MRVCACTGCSFCGGRCPRLSDSTRCDGCRKQKRRREDKRRPSARERGYDAKWERTRTAFLQAHPICGWHEGCLALATDVHHLDGQGPKGPRGHDHSNLLQLCHQHHSQITATEQKGGWNA